MSYSPQRVADRYLAARDVVVDLVLEKEFQNIAYDIDRMLRAQSLLGLWKIKASPWDVTLCFGRDYFRRPTWDGDAVDNVVTTIMHKYGWTFVGSQKFQRNGITIEVNVAADTTDKTLWQGSGQKEYTPRF